MSLVSTLIQSRRDGEQVASNIKRNIRRIENKLKSSRAVIEQYQIDGDIEPVNAAISELLAEVQILLDNNVQMQVFVNNIVTQLHGIIGGVAGDNSGSG